MAVVEVVCGPERSVPLCCVDFIPELAAERKFNATDAGDRMRNVLEVLAGSVSRTCSQVHSAWVLRNINHQSMFVICRSIVLVRSAGGTGGR